jgi:outer membrane biosynthesis protein TonB
VRAALRRPGVRFLVEALAIVLTAVVTGLGDVGAWAIAAAVAVVWVTVAVIEYSLSHPRGAKKPVAEEPPASPAPDETVRVLLRTPDPAPLTEPALEPVAVEPERAPEPVPVEPEPEPEPEAEPEPVATEPELEPVAADPAPEPEADPEPVEAREWNVWEIDRALRESGVATEEQEFLLIYLRDYAGPDGSLPVDFDGLVRESFADVLGAPAG